MAAPALTNGVFLTQTFEFLLNSAAPIYRSTEHVKYKCFNAIHSDAKINDCRNFKSESKERISPAPAREFDSCKHT